MGEWGWGWVWVWGVFHAHTYTHACTCMLNMLIMLNMDASMSVAICNFYTCIHVRVHAHACVGEHPPMPQDALRHHPQPNWPLLRLQGAQKSKI